MGLRPVKRRKSVSKVLLAEVQELIVAARQQTALAVNAGLTLVCWQVGDRIRREILKEKRAEYGEHILQTMSAKLSAEFWRGFSPRNLASMVRFAEVFPDPKILHALRAKLGWTHFRQIISQARPKRAWNGAKTFSRRRK